MKKLKKAMAAMLAVLMLISVNVPVFAATGNDGSIVINGTKAKGNFEAYRIFTVSGVDYTLEGKFEDFFKETYSSEMGTLTGVQLSEKAAEKLNNIQKGNTAEKVAFSKAVLKWVKQQEKEKVNFDDLKVTAKATDKQTTISNLPYGFYMVYAPSATKPHGTATEKTPAMMITVANEQPIEVNLKSEYPTVDKTIIPGINDPDDVTPGSGGLDVTINDKWEQTHDMGIESIATGGNAGDFTVGDIVTFKLTAKVPDMTGFADYTFKFNDTLSNGLTFDAIKKVTVGNNVIRPIAANAPANDTYSVTLAGQNLTITMNNFLQSYQNRVGETIEVYYTAKVNKNAVTGMNPNTNKADVEFSNDPNAQTTEKSESDIVKVHTFGFDIFKFHSNLTQEDGLAGAEFGLYKNESCTENGKIKLTKNQDNKTWVVSTDATDDTIVTPADGMVTVQGLSAGTYYLKELKAPADYHKLKDPIKVEIIAHYNTDTGELESYDVKYTCNGSTVSNNVTTQNNAVVKVENKKGSILPNTGGIGTVIFTVVGVVLIAGVALSFVKSRKKEEQN